MPTRHRTRSFVITLLVALAASGRSLTAQASIARLNAEPTMPKIGVGAVSAQIATGTLGSAVGFVGGGLLLRSLAGTGDADRASRFGYIGAYAGLMLLAPVGPALIGGRGNATGSYGAAQLGAVAGFAGTAFVKALGDHGAFDCGVCRPVRLLAAAAIVMLPSVGATIAFDASRKSAR